MKALLKTKCGCTRLVEVTGTKDIWIPIYNRNTTPVDPPDNYRVFIKGATVYACGETILYFTEDQDIPGDSDSCSAEIQHPL